LPSTPVQKKALKELQPEAVVADELAGEPIAAKLTKAPGNGADIGGLKVAARSGWFAVRPSGTEDLCKIYAESLVSEDHLRDIQHHASNIVQSVFAAAGD
jgi:phosphoglucomutase